jgi:hypothetical protein
VSRKPAIGGTNPTGLHAPIGTTEEIYDNLTALNEAGERISSCLAESTVNAVISMRFAKRQQMQWTKQGAYLLLQARTRTLDGTLWPLFEKWYPGLTNDNSANSAQAAAA